MTTDPTSSARPNISRTNQTKTHLKKALSSISVEQTGLNSSTVELHSQNDQDILGEFVDDCPVLSSCNAVHMGSHSLGRAMSHITLTSPTVTYRSPLVARARWLPESSAAPKQSGSMASVTNTSGTITTTTATTAATYVSHLKGKPLKRSPTSPAVIRPSELRLIQTSQPGQTVPAPAQKQDRSLVIRPVENANGLESAENKPSSSERMNSESNGTQRKQQRPTQLVIADSVSAVFVGISSISLLSPTYVHFWSLTLYFLMMLPQQ